MQTFAALTEVQTTTLTSDKCTSNKHPSDLGIRAAKNSIKHTQESESQNSSKVTVKSNSKIDKKPGVAAAKNGVIPKSPKNGFITRTSGNVGSVRVS